MCYDRFVVIVAIACIAMPLLALGASHPSQISYREEARQSRRQGDVVIAYEAKEDATIANAPPPLPGDKVVCRDAGPATGSLIGSDRVCHTVSQWERLQQQEQQDVLHAMHNSYALPPITARH